jgi:ketosteroid isomerase-like protein
MQMRLPHETSLTQLRVLFDVPGSRWMGTPIATRGERLALSRVVYEGNVDTRGGALVIEYLSVNEVDADGLCVAIVLFDLDDEDAAYAELDARFDAGEGAALRGAFSRFARNLANRDRDALLAGCAPTLVEHDHRPVIGLGTTHGAEAWVQKNIRTSTDLVPDSLPRVFHIRVCDHRTMWLMAWQGTRDGGPYEILMAGVSELDDLGRTALVDVYELEQLDQAFARFAEPSTPAVSSSPFANAASRSLDRSVRCFNARDWEGMVATYAPAHRMDDRRRLMRIAVAGEKFFANERLLFEVPGSAWHVELVATRGEQLALCRVRFTAGGEDAGPMAVEMLDLVEVDAEGRRTSLVVFDPDDLDCAYAELDRRYETGEAATYPPLASVFTRAIATGEWDALAALCAPAFVEYDHRPLAVLGTTHGPAAWVQNFRMQVELAPDTVLRSNHVRHGANGLLFHLMWQGSREGGAYEIPLVATAELDEGGKIVRADIYDHDQLDQALARFEELTAPATSPAQVGATTAAATATHFENTATRTVERAIAAFEARDWEGFGALFALEFRSFDRRPLQQLETDRAQWLASYREIVEMTSSRPTQQVLATRGDRLALVRVCWRGEQGDIGPSEIDWLLVIEVDGRGDHVAVVTFEVGDLDAAYAELDARYEAEGATHAPLISTYTRLIERRDWDAVAAMCAPAFVEHDHRPLALFAPTPGGEAWARADRTLVELAPDTVVRIHHVRLNGRACLTQVTWSGSRDGSSYEIPIALVVELDEWGRLLRSDMYDPEQLDQAWAHFEAIAVSAAPDPLAAIAKPSLAVAAFERWLGLFDAALDTDDWETVRLSCAAGMIFEDRRRLVLLSGDVELLIASARERVRAGARIASQLIGTAGDRVGIGRALWSGGPPDGRFEIEYLSVVEVDQAGLLAAMIFFDLDDARAAQREAWVRWSAIDPAAAAVAALIGELVDAFNERDPVKYRAVFADDLIVEDHRRTGMGRIEGADAYVASVVALWEVAPVSRVDAGWFWPECGRNGAITVVRRTGSVPRGGGDFESEYLYLCSVAGGRVTRVEFFETENLDAALARFEELRPDPLRIPPNAATRAIDLVNSYREAGDWDALRVLCAPVVFEDRRRLFRTTGDCEQFVANSRFLRQSGARPGAKTSRHGRQPASAPSRDVDLGP